MTANIITQSLVGLLPVCCFLAALVVLDSYKLVDIRWVLGTIVLGGVAAGISYVVHGSFMENFDISFASYSRYISPFIEEALKGLIIVLLLYKNRIGFLVDAAIFGFAIGAGFAVIENVYMLSVMPDADFRIWIIRGFGTAMMHGAATAMFAVSYRALIRETDRAFLISFIPGWLVASIVHSLYNHFFFPPVLNTLVVLVSLPLLMVVIYQQSARAVASWLDVGFDADTELLELINSADFSTSRVGLYLMTLKERFKGEIVGDMLCYLRLHVELSIRAKGLMMMRESGFDEPVGEETKAKLEEMKYLETSIGKTGKLAMNPFLQMSRKDLWQIYMLSH